MVEGHIYIPQSTHTNNNIRPSSLLRDDIEIIQATNNHPNMRIFCLNLLGFLVASNQSRDFEIGVGVVLMGDGRMRRRRCSR